MLSTHTDRNTRGNICCNKEKFFLQGVYICIPKMTFTHSSYPFLLKDHSGHEITCFARPHYSYIKPTAIHMLKSLLTNIQLFFFSSEKVVMSVGLSSTFLLLGLYYRIIVSYKRLKLGLNTSEREKDEHKPDCITVVKELKGQLMVSTLCSHNNLFIV